MEGEKNTTILLRKDPTTQNSSMLAMEIDMLSKKKYILSILILTVIFITACQFQPESRTTSTENKLPEWFMIPMIDVQTGETFSMNDFSGRVVLVETMAMWCSPCIIQAREIRTLLELLDEPEDLISVSLDVDPNEEVAALKEYTEENDFKWRFAIAPMDVARELSSLYGAQFLNPPVSAMLIIDRSSNVHTLEFGKKSAEMLLETLKPYLEP